MKKIMYFMLKLSILGLLIFWFLYQNREVTQEQEEIKKLSMHIDQTLEKLYVSDSTSVTQYNEALKKRQELRNLLGDNAKLAIFSMLGLVGVSLWIICPLIFRRKALGKKTG